VLCRRGTAAVLPQLVPQDRRLPSGKRRQRCSRERQDCRRRRRKFITYTTNYHVHVFCCIIGSACCPSVIVSVAMAFHVTCNACLYSNKVNKHLSCNDSSVPPVSAAMFFHVTCNPCSHIRITFLKISHVMLLLSHLSFLPFIIRWAGSAGTAKGPTLPSWPLTSWSATPPARSTSGAR